MHRILLTLLSIFVFNSIQAQKGYVYLEIDKNLPVEVKFNDKIVPNENKGFVIIPKVKEGENKMTFTFSNPSITQHNFYIQSINEKSKGYKLKRTENNEFVLIDIIDNKPIRNNERVAQQEYVVENKYKVDPPIEASANKNKKSTVEKNKENQSIQFKETPSEEIAQNKKKLGVIETIRAADVKKADNTIAESKKTIKNNTKVEVAEKTKAIVQKTETNVSKKIEKVQTIKDTPVKSKAVQTPPNRINNDGEKTPTPRSYAMYNQRAVGSQAQLNKDKNYRKINREKKKNSSTIVEKNKAPQAQNETVLNKPTESKKKIAVEDNRREITDNELKNKQKEVARLKELKDLQVEKIRQKQLVDRKNELEKAKAKEISKKEEALSKNTQEKLKKEVAIKKQVLEEKQRLSDQNEQEAELNKLKKQNQEKFLEEKKKRAEKQAKEKELDKKLEIARIKKEEVTAEKIAKKVTKKSNSKKNTKIDKVDDYISSMKKEIIDPEPIQKMDETNLDVPTNLTPIVASNYISKRCPKIVTDADMDVINKDMSERFDDQAKINFVKKSLVNTCYTTDHLNTLLPNLNTQNGRFKMVKELYPQLADQANINRLFQHFSFTSYREKLSQLGK